MGLFIKKNSVKILIFLFFLVLTGTIFFILKLSFKWSFENTQIEEKLDMKLIIDEVSTTTTELKIPSFAVSLSGTELEQGDSLIVIAENIPEGEEITGEFNNKSFDFLLVETEGKYVALLGIDAKKAPGKYPLSVFLSGEPKIEKTITVKKSNFFVTEMPITPELEEEGFTSENIAENIATKDGVIIYEVLVKYSPEAYFNQSFVYPLEKIINVGAFGNIRKDGGITIQHLGVDLDAIEGTPIYAVNSGKVVLVEKLTVYGDTIIIDHGLGIYSLYLHLSEFKVIEGQMLKRKELIGLSGNTGWSVGPHLHLSIKVNGASVDPLKFIEVVDEFLN